MELKPAHRSAYQGPDALLIVPYGIETIDFVRDAERIARLLIVPYGIETRYVLNRIMVNWLLIVPYGIETFSGLACISDSLSFNRTLWN